MRIFPFFAPILVSIFFVPTLTQAEEIRVYAGRNWTAAKLQNAGNDQLEKGDLESARRSFDAAIKLDPTMWPAYYNRARLFLKQHKWALAVQDATMALRGSSSVTQSALLRAKANRHLGNYKASLADLDKVISLRPEGTYPSALNSRAWLRATCPDASFRNGKQAIEDAKVACGATIYRKAAFVDTLAAAYAEAGDFDSALRYEERAVAVENSSTEQTAEIKEKLQQHLALFRQGSVVPSAVCKELMTDLDPRRIRNGVESATE
jgi:tetratricopeptide (TPR) repeat protein